MILYLPGEPVSLWYWRASLIAGFDDLGSAALKLDRRQVARCQLGQQIGQLNGQRIRAVHWRRKGQDVELAS